MKGSNGIIAIDTDETKEQACIKCGRCVDVCPMELSPLYFVKYADQENWEGMRDMAFVFIKEIFIPTVEKIAIIIA